MANAGPGTVTITSTTGPGQTVTAAVLSSVSNISVDLNGNVISISYINGSGVPTIGKFDYSAMATVTWTISGGATSVTITS